MAIRPYLISGVALASAGAIVAATPAVDFSRDVEVRAAAPAPTMKKLRVEQLQLLAVTLQGISDAFFQGYGGEDPETRVEPAGFPGVAYYIGEQTIFADTFLDNYFYEAGFVGAAKFLLSEVLGGDPSDFDFISNPIPTIGQIAVTVAEALGPDAAGITEAFFFGYPLPSSGPDVEPDNAGFVGVLNYVVDRVIEIIGALPSAATESADTDGTQLRASTEVDEKSQQTDPGLTPNLDIGKLVNLSTNPLSKTVDNVRQSFGKVQDSLATGFAGATDPVNPPTDLTTAGTEEAKKEAGPEIEILPTKNDEEEADVEDDGGAKKFVPVILGNNGSAKSRGWNPLRGIEKRSLGIGGSDDADSDMGGDNDSHDADSDTGGDNDSHDADSDTGGDNDSDGTGSRSGSGSAGGGTS